MRRRLPDLIGAAALATIVLAALLILRPLGRELVLHVYLVVMAAIVLAGAVAAVNAAAPRQRRSAFDEALRRRPPEDRRPPQLERVERAVTIGVGAASAFDFHARLRPLLREVAQARLARSRGVDLDSPEGRAAVGEDAWALLRPDRPPPDDRHAAGLDRQRLQRLVEMLETL